MAPESISYTYDAMGNRVAQSGSYLNGTFSYDADDELTAFTYSGTSYASATFGYNANGERTSETTGLSPGSAGYASQFGYDFDGNLTGITAAGKAPVSFEYDGLNRQLGWQSGGSQLDYQLDGNVPLTETNQTSSRVNLYGNGLVSSGGETLLYDGLGAVRQTRDAGQNVVSSATYQAFGVPLATSGSTGNHYQWGAGSGYRSDGFGPTDAAALLKVGARYYDPEFGCFLTRDTDLGQKPYTYCNSDPVNFSDPTGHDDQDPDPDYEHIGGSGNSSGSGADDPNGTGGDNPDGCGPGNHDPGNAGPATTNTGSGTVTISTSGSSVTGSYTQNGETVSATEKGGNITQFSESGIIHLGGGMSVNFGSGFNPGTGLGSGSVGLNYSNAGISAGISLTNTGTTTLNIGGRF